ncbi:MAG TPA: hypothetical protein ENJ10_01525 [Caldithrix abyssi]|uniref:Uncharacterized protein n=1 Tax=Caldithrix abyssi TaxID=187145 RepID=A0A7V1PTE3_CALAY|nr:hypothetical protein [Caldithrix abyssi]
MPGINDKMTLNELITQCASEQISEKNRAWQIFWQRYHSRIYGFARYACQKSIRPQHRSFNDVVDDVVGDVLFILNNELDGFRSRDDEGRFLAWLSMIVNRAALRYMQKNYSRLYFNDRSEETECAGELFNCWELYDYIVAFFRKIRKKNSVQSERDISIFMLYTFADFSPEAIKNQPCMKNVSLRAIQLVVSRMKKKLETDRLL